jgi:hypothetical protein
VPTIMGCETGFFSSLLGSSLAPFQAGMSMKLHVRDSSCAPQDPGSRWLVRDGTKYV